MWVRNKKTGAAEFVIDPARAVAMVHAGEAEAIDELPDIEPADEPEPKPVKGAKAKK